MKQNVQSETVPDVADRNKKSGLKLLRMDKKKNSTKGKNVLFFFYY